MMHRAQWCAAGQHVAVSTFGTGKLILQWTPDPTWDSNYIQSVVHQVSPLKQASRTDLNIQGGSWLVSGIPNDVNGEPGEMDWAVATCES